jgi:hypothetical protein
MQVQTTSSRLLANAQHRCVIVKKWDLAPERLSRASQSLIENYLPCCHNLAFIVLLKAHFIQGL